MSVKTKVTELPDSRVRLDAEVPSEDVESSLQKAAREIGRDLRLPGFRKGKVPPAMVIQRVGREAVLEEAVRESLPGWYEQALIQADVSMVGEPKLDFEGLPPAGEPLTFSVEVAVTPKATLGRYRELEVGRREPNVPDDAIDHELEHLREAFARAETVDRPAGEGDHVVVDFVGKVDGEPFAGGEARDYMLELGGGRLIEGFEEQLVGASAGDERTVEVDFPEEYHAEDLRGKHAEFEVHVKEVKEKELPPLDDDFASQASEFDTVDELRADIRSKLEQAQESSIQEEFREAAVDAAAAEAQIELPDELVTARAEEMWSRMEASLRRQNIDPEMYMQASGRTREEILDEAKEGAAQQLRRESVLTAVAEEEGIEVSDEELLDVLRRASEGEKTNPEKLLERLKRDDRDVPLRRDLRLRKAAEIIADTAVAIDLETAKAREKLWTPEKEREPGSPQLWTPGQEPPPGAGAGTAGPPQGPGGRRAR